MPTPDFNATNIAVATLQAAQAAGGVPIDPALATSIAVQTQQAILADPALATSIAVQTQQAILADTRPGHCDCDSDPTIFAA